jgi:hypothetical protein
VIALAITRDADEVGADALSRLERARWHYRSGLVYRRSGDAEAVFSTLRDAVRVLELPSNEGTRG